MSRVFLNRLKDFSSYPKKCISLNATLEMFTLRYSFEIG